MGLLLYAFLLYDISLIIMLAYLFDTRININTLHPNIFYYFCINDTSRLMLLVIY